jgi:predicted MFS family arabinose efflux permease
MLINAAYKEKRLVFSGVTAIYCLKKLLDYWELEKSILSRQEKQLQETKRLHAAHRQLILLMIVSVYSVFALYSYIFHFIKK